MNYVKYIGVPMVALLMAACAQKTETAYYWGDYQSSVYDYYNNNTSTQQQIDALNKIIEQAKEKNKPVPPGLHAHLGLLYVETQHSDLAFQQFNAEKTQFPESAAYMDFLMRHKENK